MIGLLTIGLIGLALCTKKRGVSGVGYRAFGGNSGYDGYSMSVRARKARAEGKYPKTDFRKIYHLTTAAFDALVRTHYIINSEWHHTSKFGNRTEFYEWDKPELASFYLENKKQIDLLAREKDYDAIEDIMWEYYVTL